MVVSAYLPPSPILTLSLDLSQRTSERLEITLERIFAVAMARVATRPPGTPRDRWPTAVRHSVGLCVADVWRALCVRGAKGAGCEEGSVGRYGFFSGRGGRLDRWSGRLNRWSERLGRWRGRRYGCWRGDTGDA